ncbi:Peptidyl-prolyl cis-trans isomerase PpiD [hydrothermal vent metagenome]|uniref:Peptidyl-prolyl cis-trans isomerase PpiD n=1 Tax=hydrothermal vent metagenome TaxID=652676 RepID=A0A1W1EI02_9ZZZZ
MISWMQKHNRYLIITIWIATIAFIGAGFVGWGSYNYSSKTGAVAQVGDIEITKAKLDMTYSNIYEQYNSMLQGKFDDAQAKKMNLIGQAFESLKTQARLLNLANEFGIIVTDVELAINIKNIKGFQKDGKFNQSIYDQYIQRLRVKPIVFENIIRDDMKIQKLFRLLKVDSLEYEQNILASGLNLRDKIKYRVISSTSPELNITMSDKELKEYWQKNKSAYMTPIKYRFDILWSDTNGVVVDDKEIEEFYKENSFNYINDNSTQLSLEDAKDIVTRDLKLKKIKKDAQKKYIAFKKDKITKSETIILNQYSSKFSKELWEKIDKKSVNDIIKPQIVGDRYATIKIIEIKPSQEMSFEEAKDIVKLNYKSLIITKEMKKLAEETLKTIKDNNVMITSEYLSLDKLIILEGLTPNESASFVSQLFKVSEAQGTIELKDKIVVYDIIEQKKIIDNNNSKIIEDTMNKIKNDDFQINLLKELSSKYEVKIFVKGL